LISSFDPSQKSIKSPIIISKPNEDLDVGSEEDIGVVGIIDVGSVDTERLFISKVVSESSSPFIVPSLAITRIL
jgi:hypothetical protein